MTTHEYARKLLADIDCPLSWPVCRACQKRMRPGSGVSTGATEIGEGCFMFHRKCFNALPDKAQAQANKCSSRFFKDSL